MFLNLQNRAAKRRFGLAQAHAVQNELPRSHVQLFQHAGGLAELRPGGYARFDHHDGAIDNRARY